MKKIMFVWAIAFSVIVTSCGKDDGQWAADNTSDETTSVEINLSALNIPQTRAGFFDDAMLIPYSAENTLQVITVYVYSSSDELVKRFDLAVDYKDSHTATLSLPQDLCGTTCKFYVVANLYGISYKSHIKNATYTWNSQLPHNSGTLPPMMEDSFWSGGSHFSMAAVEDVFIEPYGQKTYASISLRRHEAKLALRLKVADDFSATHKGATLILTETTLNNLSDAINVFSDKTINNANRSLTQTTHLDGGYYHNLFYLLPRIGGTPVNITIKGIYDRDGKSSTTDDQTPVEFEIPVSPSADVNRNTYYRIDGVVKGVGKLNVDFVFTVRPWTVFPPQNIEIGG